MHLPPSPPGVRPVRLSEPSRHGRIRFWIVYRPRVKKKPRLEAPRKRGGSMPERRSTAGPTRPGSDRWPLIPDPFSRSAASARRRGDRRSGRRRTGCGARPMPGCRPRHSADDPPVRGGRMAAQDRQGPLGGRGRHEGHQPALVGHVERVEPQQLARPGHRLATREWPLRPTRCPPGRPGRSRSAPRPVRRGSDRGGSAMSAPAASRAADQAGQRRTVALQGPFKLRALRGPT